MKIILISTQYHSVACKNKFQELFIQGTTRNRLLDYGGSSLLGQYPNQIYSDSLSTIKQPN